MTDGTITSMRTTHTIQIVTATMSIPSALNEYTHGLTGTDQPGNYLSINLLVTFLAIIGSALIIIRLCKLEKNRLRAIASDGPAGDDQEKWSRNQTTLFPWVKRHILYAPLWNMRHNTLIQLPYGGYSIGTIPSRLHSIMLVIYFIGNIIACAVVDYNVQGAHVLAELRGRAGALAAWNMIPCFIFAGRNNPLIWLTRVSYDTFNLLHRWTGRIVILEALAHTGFWLINEVEVNGWAGARQKMGDAFIYYGLIATVFFVLKGILALSPIRHAYYEFFLSNHRTIALICIIGVYQHLNIASLPQIPYIVIVIIVWSLEMLARFGRIVYYNVAYRDHTEVLVESLPGEAVRLSFRLVRCLKFTPGSHVHVWIPSMSLFSSHPFSLAWAEDHDVPQASYAGNVENGKVLEHNFSAQHRIATTVSCVVRAEKGMTRKLYNKAADAPNRFITLKAAIEGPYGGHEALDSYGTVLLFAGGVGITHQMGFVRQLVHGSTTGTVATRKVVLVWSLTRLEHMTWVKPWMDQVLAFKGRKGVLECTVHVTRGHADANSKSGGVMIRKGRCDIQKTVVRVFQDRIGAMAVTVCGPGMFSDDVRQAVRPRVTEGSIDFVEEAFTY